MKHPVERLQNDLDRFFVFLEKDSLFSFNTEEKQTLKSKGMELSKKLDAVEKGTFESDIIRSADDVYVDLSFLYDMKKRIPLTGKSPRHIAVSAGKIYVTAVSVDIHLAG